MPPAEARTVHINDSVQGGREDDLASGLRNQDIEEASNRLVIHRISKALIPVFIWARITPNMVSCLGALSGFAAAFCYYNFQSTTACLAGFLFMVGWHVFDGADGQLARLTGQCSPLGFVIDGVCDYATFIFVYVALALALSTTMGHQVWILVVGAGICHAIQAAAFEMQREHYIHWTTHGAPKETPNCEVESKDAASAVGSMIERCYRFTQELFRPLSFQTEQEVAAKVKQGLSAKYVADSYKTHFRKVVLRWSLLSANNRTLAIFIFCLAGYPLGYFIYEAALLSLALVGLLRLNKSSRSEFMEAISAQGRQTS